MTSDEKGDKGLEIEDNAKTVDTGKGIASEESTVGLASEEGEASDAELSAGFDTGFEPDMDVDITGDENIDFADEDDGSLSGGSNGGALKKLVAPALVLVLAAGLGGYIVMNPQVLGQGATNELPQPENPYLVESSQLDSFSTVVERDGEAEQAANDATFAQKSDPVTASLPQPTVNQNEAAPVVSAIFETVEKTMPEMPSEVLMEAVPEVSNVTEVVEVTPSQSEGLMDVSEVDILEPLEEYIDSVEETAALSDELFELTPIDEDAVLFEEVKDVSSSPVMEESFDVSEVSKIEPAAEIETTEGQKSGFQDNAQGAASAPVAPSEVPSVPASSDSYFDGRIPTGPLATSVGPRKVDPVLEPATQYVVVKKNYDGKDLEAMLVSANRALKLKRYQSALEMFEQLYDKNPRDPRILMGKAVAQQKLGLLDTAIMSYEELLEIKPGDADAMLNMMGLIRKQYPSVALRRLMNLYEQYPNNAGIAAQIGVTQADLDHYDDAMRYLGIASSLEPRNAQHAFNMAIIADRNGDTKSAVSHYERALEMDAIYSSGRSVPREIIYDRLSILRRR